MWLNQAVLAIAVAIAVNVNLNKDNNLSSVSLANLEALAQDMPISSRDSGNGSSYCYTASKHSSDGHTRKTCDCINFTVMDKPKLCN